MLLELKDIAKYYPVRRTFGERAKGMVRAVDKVSLSIAKGDSFGLVGESGCGKTTLARLILRLYKLSAGRIMFDGQDVTRVKGRRLKDYRQKVQIVFQDPFSSLDPRFSVRNIMKEAMTLDPKKYPTDSAKEKRILDLLASVGLSDDMINRYPHEFSGGERQRIAIARALMLNPKLLILDEAVSSLDVIIQEQILTLLANLQQRFNLTYLFISHNLKVVRRICQTIAVMYKGKIVELGPSEAIFTNPLHEYTRELLSAALDYRSSLGDRTIDLGERSGLAEREEGHWILC